MLINNMTVVITGGASGLGEATLRYLHAKGANVVAFDLNEAAGNALVQSVGEAKSFFQKVDVTCDEGVRDAVAAVVEKFGTIHAVINCAGIPNPCKILDRDGNATELERFSTTINVNLVGSFNVMSKCAEVMAKNTPDAKGERGVIINVSSCAAYDGQVGQSAYSSSKAAINGLNLPAARELGTFNIRVNAIAPGLFGTPMVQSLGEKVVASLINQAEAPKRLGELDEFAHCCAFIIENSYLNGETIRLDAVTRLQARG